MRLIKRLDLYILRKFLPLFAMTFFIVLFIVLMQFLWKYIDDLVGKGLEIMVLAELFFYAAVSMVPMALPLAILLASLMTFGNLGEKSELTAIKAAGVSLIQVMRPLIILVTCIAIGAFFFQNDVLPRAQVKMWTLLFSAKQKSPEVEIPEGVFYDQIPGFHLFVKEKNRETGEMHKVMIYDIQHGGDNATILMADTAQLAFTKDMKYLYLHLRNGEQFENLKEQSALDRNVPFRRESFAEKEILIPFDNNFNRLDESGMRSQFVGKNIKELQQTIDSITVRIDSMGADFALDLKRSGFSNVISYSYFEPNKQPKTAETPTRNLSMNGNIDSLFNLLNPKEKAEIYNQASQLLQSRFQENEYRAITIADERKSIRRHEIELIKKFTLSVACLIFFFIGAPLGAIIRKGGLGTPLVISVLLFLVYYIIDNTGYKMAREGRTLVWFGMWLSTFILLPLGIFVTYKAMNDSVVFNKDYYRALFTRLLGLPEKRHIKEKEVIINEVDRRQGRMQLAEIYAAASSWLSRHDRLPSYIDYWRNGMESTRIDEIGKMCDRTVVYLTDSRNFYIVNKLNEMPVTRGLWILDPTTSQRLRRIFMWFFPIGLPLYLVALPYARRIGKELRAAQATSLAELLLLK